MAKMQALQLHTYHGKEYQPGATYDADDGDVNTIEVQGKGARVDASQKPAEKPAEKPKAATPAKKAAKPAKPAKIKKGRRE